MEVRPCASIEELSGALAGIGHYFGVPGSDDRAERAANWLELERVLAARADGQIVGGAATVSFDVSVPGGATIPCGGVTVVGVLPTHRRRGLLNAMMQAQLEDARARGEAIACLWASEAAIYGRYGYGLATRIGELTLGREHTSFDRPFEPRGEVALIDADAAGRVVPAIYERMRASRPGMMSRSEAWWRTRRLDDDPSRRRGGGPLVIALLSLDGEPAAYALYRVTQDWQAGVTDGTVRIVEAVTPTAESTRELWRWLLDFDWTSRFVAGVLPPDHPLFLLLAEPARMAFRVADGLHARLVDVEAALRGRAYAGGGEVVLEVADPAAPWNEGCFRVTGEGVERTRDAADLRLGVAALGSVYLGAFRFADLARAMRVEELRAGAVERADALFRADAEPWCAEIF
ncbi:MAG TPA: GNAT family N-acetyltransferase [Gaiellaceae bacterium]